MPPRVRHVFACHHRMDAADSAHCQATMVDKLVSTSGPPDEEYAHVRKNS